MKIGILGNGQLGMMLGEAAKKLGIELSCFGPSSDSPASHTCRCIEADFTEASQLRSWIKTQDRISYEFENIPSEAITILKEFPGKIFPQTIALEVMQNRLREKLLAHAHGAKTARYLALDQPSQPERIITLKNYFLQNRVPMLIKTVSFGYDGKGQAKIRNEKDLESSSPLLQQVCIAEHLVAFETEVSLIACRGQMGELGFYPLSENFHGEGILRVSRSLSPVTIKLQKQAEVIATKILNNLQYVGILTIEFFVVGDELYINEFAPRVHNSGHWTIEGSETSQFENHLRAVSGIPLGSTRSKPSLLFNLIGDDTYDTEKLKSGIFHTYHKAFRPGRKVGHVTVVKDTFEQLPALERLL